MARLPLVLLAMLLLALVAAYFATPRMTYVEKLAPAIQRSTR